MRITGNDPYSDTSGMGAIAPLEAVSWLVRVLGVGDIMQSFPQVGTVVAYHENTY